MTYSITFGPVPSRRLGRSLGINNIPPKVCPYACGYCQLGRTLQMQIERHSFYEPDDIIAAVETRVVQVQAAGETIDYLTFVPDGEPTLDLNLGREIEALRGLGLPIAVISNAALIWREDVRADLMQADWVSLKVDAVRPEIWRWLDRPHGALSLEAILEGALAFAADFTGQLVTETMLVAGINDRPDGLAETAEWLAQVQPDVAYLSIPTRPPAEPWAGPPDEAAVNRAYQIFSARLLCVEYLVGYEGDAFSATNNVQADLLSITAVHPMRQDAVSKMLACANASWAVVAQLLAQGQLIETDYQGEKFYLRKLEG